MNLRERAKVDANRIVRDVTAGFGTPFTITSPENVSADLVGLSNDIADLIDPQTGLNVTGRRASVAVNITALGEAGLGIPSQIQDPNKRPWIVRFNDVNGKAHTFKVLESKPDRTIDLVVLLLEFYKIPVS